MKAYLVADVTVHDAAMFSEYLSEIPDYVHKYDGRYLVKGGASTIIEGTWHPETMIVIEFPSKNKLNQFVGDVEVQALFAQRQGATNSNLIVIDGCE
jgi:uncharacterized protein (DUF1330 family)